MKLLILCVIFGLLGAAWVRFAPISSTWHVLPSTLGELPARNSAKIEISLKKEQVIAQSEFESALQQAGESLTTLAGQFDDGHVTYIIRTKWLRFPDVVTYARTDTSTGSQLTLLSRSIYGYSDLGVNRARLQRVLSNLGLVNAATTR